LLDAQARRAFGQAQRPGFEQIGGIAVADRVPPTNARERRSSTILRTAFVSTYPPRRCGIATFTSDLAAVTPNSQIAALHPTGPALPYDLKVRHRIRKDDRASYVEVAESLSRSVDVVSIQHEYGIWGGEDGDHVLDFVGALRVPAVATLHTVLREPTPRQRSILTQLASLAQSTVVMSRSAANLLTSVYSVNRNSIAVIPHGVPNVPLVEPAVAKPLLGIEGRDVLLSFGLLGPGKGYELAIAALPEVVAAHPSALYVILGATHPDLVAREGEAYRRSLAALVDRLGLGNHVQLVDRYVGRNELIHWLEAADAFVTPYPNLSQIVSGTLSYAMGAGRAVVSTPYAYATELLADGRGVLVGSVSSGALATGLNAVLGDPTMRTAIGRRAYAYSRKMLWPAVGAAYSSLFADVVGEASPAIAPLRTRVAVHA
jgi:glycosyltransferase involved in cell wall biosynthesis